MSSNFMNIIKVKDELKKKKKLGQERKASIGRESRAGEAQTDVGKGSGVDGSHREDSNLILTWNQEPPKESHFLLLTLSSTLGEDINTHFRDEMGKLKLPNARDP